MMKIHVWNNSQIRQKDNGFVCLSDMAKAGDYRIGDFLRNKETQDYISGLAKDIGCQESDLLYSEGQARSTLVWSHPEISMDLARKISIEFHIWANRVIHQVDRYGFYATPQLKGYLACAVRFIKEDIRMRNLYLTMFPEVNLYRFQELAKAAKLPKSDQEEFADICELIVKTHRYEAGWDSPKNAYGHRDRISPMRSMERLEDAVDAVVDLLQLDIEGVEIDYEYVMRSPGTLGSIIARTLDVPEDENLKAKEEARKRRKQEFMMFIEGYATGDWYAIWIEAEGKEPRILELVRTKTDAERTVKSHSKICPEHKFCPELIDLDNVQRMFELTEKLRKNSH